MTPVCRSETRGLPGGKLRLLRRCRPGPARFGHANSEVWKLSPLTGSTSSVDKPNAASLRAVERLRQYSSV